MLDTLIKYKLLIVISNTELIIIFTKIRKNLMKENIKDSEFCIKIALDNAKKRINILKNSDKKSVFEEYKEWINDGLSKHSVLLLREDPII